MDSNMSYLKKWDYRNINQLGYRRFLKNRLRLSQTFERLKKGELETKISKTR